MPRSDSNYADQKTDIFALGSTIYYMMTGHEPFPELNPNVEGVADLDKNASILR